MAKIILEFPIYTYQIDFSRHVSNIVYLQWMEAARMKLLEAVGLPVHVTAESEIVPVLMDTEISYKKPLFLGDVVRVESWISEMKRASAWLEFRFYNGGGELAATGRQRGVFVELSNMRPQRLSAEHAALFAGYVHEN